MSKSPLQVVELFFPEFSYRANPAARGTSPDAVVTVKIEASVLYCADAQHVARIFVSQDDDSSGKPYTLQVEGYAVFTFEKHLATQTWKKNAAAGVAINAVSILFSGIREAVANATARGPFGSMYLESMIFEPDEIEIDFEQHPKELLPALFATELPADAKVTRVLDDQSPSVSVRSKKRAKKGSSGKSPKPLRKSE